jgi:hypothetical protein
MKSLLSLFEETRKEKPTRLKYFNSEDIYEDIPFVDYPSFNSEDFDIDEVERCFNKPCLSTSFLRNSDKSVFDIYKSYCESNDINNLDWDKIKEILNDVEVIVGKLKRKFNRSRPSNFMNGEYSIKYKNSPSYPSGHTTIAYFLCDLVSNSIPDCKQDLQTLAGLIGQSRIENAVHYPSDVSYGRLIGEFLANSFINEKPEHNNENLLSKILTHCESNKISKNQYSREIAEFIFEVNSASGVPCSYTDCLEASQNFLMGFPIKYITKNEGIKSLINCMITANYFEEINNERKLIAVHKGLGKDFVSCNPGEKRNYKSLNEVFKLSKHQKYKKIMEEKPFVDGNLRVGKIMLLSDLGFDFVKFNEII